MYLMHYGIKDMHWGIRRYQNEDGTWTEDGLERRRLGTSTIKKGSSVRRITARNIDETENPIGLYTYGTTRAQPQYKAVAKWLPSVDNTFSGKAKKAKITQYEFVRDATLVEGQQAVNDFIDTYGKEKIGDFVSKYDVNRLADFITATRYQNLANVFPERTIVDQYNRIRQNEGMRAANDFAHGYLHFKVTETIEMNGEQKPIMQHFVNKYKNMNIDAIVDPEDFTANFEEPILILNRDSVKQTKSRNVRL